MPKYYYSGSTRGFYPTDAFAIDAMPPDVVAVRDEDYQTLMASQRHGVGVAPDADGYPILIAVRSTPAEMWERIKIERDRRSETGGYKVGSHWFHSDQKSRSQQLGLVLLGANIPSGLQWKTMDGSFVTMTQTLAGQILAAAAASDQAIFATAETHKAAMEASADPASYNYLSGWPAGFGE